METMHDHERDTGVNTSRRVWMPLVSKTVTTELSEDFTLPDYQPEIRRLLSVTATVQPPEKFVGTGSAEFSGTVDYSVLYTGNDGGLYCAPLSGEYRFTVPYETDGEFDLSGEPIFYALPRAEATTGRVTAPRRLTVKCRLGSRVRGFCLCPIGERIVGEVPLGDVAKLLSECKTEEVLYGKGEEFTLTEEILSDTGGAPVRVVMADGKVFPGACEPGSGEIRSRGEVIVTLLLATEPAGDADPFVPELRSITRKIPYQTTIPVEGADVSFDAVCFGACADLSVSVEEGRILVDVGVVCETLCRRARQTEYTADLYAVRRETVMTYTQRRLPVPLCMLGGNFTAGGSAALEEVGIRPGARVADTSGEVEIMEVTPGRSGGTVVLSGTCRFRILTEAGGEYAVSEAVFPFRYEAKAEGETGTAPEFDAHADMVLARARMDGERISVDGEVVFCCRLSEEVPVRMPDTVRFGESVPPPCGEMKVYYPAPGETLWDVAKRYRVRLDTLAAANGLPDALRADDPASLGKNKFLVIR